MSPHLWEGACCCQSFTDGSRCNNRSLAGGPSLYSSSVDLGCRSCMCSFVGTWATHAGHLGGPGRQRRPGSSTREAGGDSRGRVPGESRPVGCESGWSVPFQTGADSQAFWKPLGTPVVAELPHGPRQRPKALGAEAHGGLRQAEPQRRKNVIWAADLVFSQRGAKSEVSVAAPRGTKQATGSECKRFLLSLGPANDDMNP